MSNSIDRTTDIINRINDLKNVEQSLYTQLENINNLPNPNPAKQKEIIDNINKVVKTRGELYRNLNDMYVLLQTDINTIQNSDVYKAQSNALDLIKGELERAEKNKEIMESDKNNKLRMTEINTYYSKRYEASADIMMLVIYVTIPLLILAILKSKGYIPRSLANFATIIILTVGGVKIGTRLLDMMRRSNVDYDKYSWSFNADSIDANALNGSVSGDASIALDCYGPACCDGVSTMWNDDKKVCVPKPVDAASTLPSTSTGSSSSNAGTSNTGTSNAGTRTASR